MSLDQLPVNKQDGVTTLAEQFHVPFGGSIFTFPSAAIDIVTKPPDHGWTGRYVRIKRAWFLSSRASWAALRRCVTVKSKAVVEPKVAKQPLKPTDASFQSLKTCSQPHKTYRNLVETLMNTLLESLQNACRTL